MESLDNLFLFESFVSNINEAEKGLMHRLLKIPADKKITDVYKSGEELAKDLLTAVKKSKIVPSKDIRKKATSMLAFAANWPNDGSNSVMDKALRSIKDMEIPGVPVNESFWSSIFGKPSIDDAARDSLKGKGFSHRGRDEGNYIMFDGQKFYPDQVEYDDVYSTKPIPRIENGKLIVANPAWNL
jgi:hypothetical protein